MKARNKTEHKRHLQAAPKRSSAPDFRFPQPSRLERQRILIVCEGLNTEPDYFRNFRRFFRLANAEVVEIGGAGETIRVVERAKNEASKSRFDQVWVVFDKDDFPAEHFDNAIYMAKAMEFGVAYSNQAFEYWLILHFEDHQGGAMHRRQYPEKLNAYLAPYALRYDAGGKKQISTALFQLLMGKDPRTGEDRLSLALKRAQKGLAFHDNTSSPAAKESSTTVSQLVAELLKFI